MHAKSVVRRYSHACAGDDMLDSVDEIRVLHGESDRGQASSRTTTTMAQIQPPTTQPCSQRTKLYTCHLTHHTAAIRNTGVVNLCHLKAWLAAPMFCELLPTGNCNLSPDQCRRTHVLRRPHIIGEGCSRILLLTLIICITC